MKGYFRASFAYLLCALLVAVLIHDDPARLWHDMQVSLAVWAVIIVDLVTGMALWLGLAVAVAVLVAGWRGAVSRVGPILLAVAATICLQAGFSFFKNAIPEIVPYYADPMLARFDAWLHGGVDPWVWVHGLWPPAAVLPWLRAYMDVWAVPAMLFAVFLVAVDSDAERIRRYLWLYFGSWLVLGNLMAIGLSSVGPVYYDRLIEGAARFAGLSQALIQSGVAGSGIGLLQEALWQRFLRGGVDPGLGISAFPSMHVAVAALCALYLTERSRWLALPGWGFVVVIQFLSVYTGYHYAIDGYVSVLVLIVANWAFRRKKVAREGGVTIATCGKVV